MSYGWLQMHSPLDDAPFGRPEDALDWPYNEHTADVHDLFLQASFRLAGCLQGSRWIAGAYPDEGQPRIQTYMAVYSFATGAVAQPTVRRSRLLDFGGPTRESAWELAVPAGWLRAPADAYVAVKVLQAGLAAVAQVGDRLGIGLPDLRKPSLAATSRVAPIAFEGTPEPSPSSRAGVGWLDRRYARLGPGELLLVGRGDVGAELGQRQRAVAGALRARGEDSYAEEVSLTCWTVRDPLSR